MQETIEIRRKLSIALVCDPVGSNKSGVVVSTMRFGKLLRERGHHVIFIAAKSNEHRSHSEHDGIKTYRYRSLPIPKSGGWYTALPSVRELKKVFQKENIDIVHITIPMTASIMAIRAARALGIKVIAHSHSQPENLFMDAPKFIQPTLHKAWNRGLAWLYNKAESLVYPSELAYSLLSNLSRKGQPWKVISNGINTGVFKPLPVGDFYERYKIPKDTVKLLFVGRLFPEKSVHTLIEAVPHIIEKHPNVHVMLVGGGHLRASLEKLVEKLKVSKYITFLGLVSEEDKIHAYNASDIFILPSVAELEGMVVLEAMACGKPIVISDAKMSASRFFVEGNGFLFKTHDHKDLAHQILKLVTDEELRKKLGEVSFEKSKQYDIHKSVDKLEEVYYAALKS